VKLILENWRNFVLQEAKYRNEVSILSRHVVNKIKERINADVTHIGLVENDHFYIGLVDPKKLPPEVSNALDSLDTETATRGKKQQPELKGQGFKGIWIRINVGEVAPPLAFEGGEYNPKTKLISIAYTLPTSFPYQTTQQIQGKAVLWEPFIEHLKGILMHEIVHSGEADAKIHWVQSIDEQYIGVLKQLGTVKTSQGNNIVEIIEKENRDIKEQVQDLSPLKQKIIINIFKFAVGYYFSKHELEAYGRQAKEKVKRSGKKLSTAQKRKTALDRLYWQGAPDTHSEKLDFGKVGKFDPWYVLVYSWRSTIQRMQPLSEEENQALTEISTPEGVLKQVLIGPMGVLADTLTDHLKTLYKTRFAGKFPKKKKDEKDDYSSFVKRFKKKG